MGKKGVARGRVMSPDEVDALCLEEDPYQCEILAQRNKHRRRIEQPPEHELAGKRTTVHPGTPKQHALMADSLALKIDGMLAAFDKDGSVPNQDDIKDLVTIECLRALRGGEPQKVKAARDTLVKIQGLEIKRVEHTGLPEETPEEAAMRRLRASQDAPAPEMPTNTAGSGRRRLQAAPPGQEEPAEF